MDNPVVIRMAEVAQSIGVATLRFNFRGVGASSGKHGGGEAEQEDVKAALGALAERLGTIGEHMNAGQAQMIRFAESSLGQNEAVRTHLRAIEGYMARLNEELAEGRAQSVAELRNEIRLLARTIAALADESGR